MSEFQVDDQPSYGSRPGWRLSRKVRVWVYQNLIPLLAYPLIRGLGLSYRWRVHVAPELLDLLRSGKPFAVAIWHGDMQLIQSVGRFLGFEHRAVVMVALSQAGEIEARILRMLGYHVVRGSARKRGAEAFEEMAELVQRGAIPAFVVDGPSGPAGTAKAGAIRLAQRCQIPIVPIAFRPGREWKAPTWDATRVPLPFSRCLAVSTEPLLVPADLGGESIEVWTQRLADRLHDLERRDIDWAGAAHPRIIPKPAR